MSNPRKGLTRRAGLTALAAGIGAGMTRVSVSDAKAAPMAPLATGAALYQDVVAYDGFGIHRTGTAGDRETAQWLRNRMAAAGYDTRLAPFPFIHFDPQTAEIRFGSGSALEGHAQWPVTYTGSSGLHAPLGLYNPYTDAQDLRGKIAVVPLPHMRHSTLLEPRVMIHMRRIVASGAAAAVLVPFGPTGALLAMNAPPKMESVSLPLLVVPPNKAGALLDAASRSTRARLVIDGAGPVRRTAHNLVARRGREGPWVVVSTPMSGWFHCAAERGPGIAVFLALATTLPAMAPGRRILFVANSGHELENAGAKDLLASVAPPPEETELWLHLGAGLAARDILELDVAPILRPDADTQRVLMGSLPFVPVLRKHFAGLPGLADAVEARLEWAAGELRDVVAAGYPRVFGAFGAHPYHHAPEDRSDKTSPDLLEGLNGAVHNAMTDILRAGR